jgi:hypothetical protein
MHWGGPFFVLSIIAMVMLAKVVTAAIHARHGYPLGLDRRGRRHRGEEQLPDQRATALLSAENERLTGRIGRLEERIAVLERIATDPAERTAREIEALRDR